MFKKIRFLLLFVVAIAPLFAIASCSTAPTKFKVEYAPGECGGESIIVEYLSGEEFTIIENNFVYENHNFTGWLFNDKVYSVGEKFTMKNENIKFVAQWEEIVSSKHPTFLETTFTVDKSVGSETVLGLNLDGAEIYYIELDGELYSRDNYSYDDIKQAIVISAEATSKLSVGEHTIVVYTNVVLTEPLECKLVITQSITTSFDTVTTKTYLSKVVDGVSFNVGFNGTNITKITLNGNLVSEQYYQKGENNITIKKELLDRYCSAMEFVMYLSNNDTYTFIINTNVLFATDYDYNTIHDTTASNLGHNPLYQYYDNVKIVDGPEGFEGNVLKITPNTTDVTYDCHGYFTIKGPNVGAMWYELPLKAIKYYHISFDYMTEGTSVGEFRFDVSNGSKIIANNLLLGSENDNVIHHFSRTYNGTDLIYCLYVWAKFVGGGGSIYFDNFRITELDIIPVLSSGTNYEQEGNYVFNFAPNGYDYSVHIDNEEVEYTFDNNTITITEATMNTYSAGIHTIMVKTSLSDLSFSFNIIEKTIVSEFQENTYVHHYLSATDNPKLYGNFSNGVTLVSLKQTEKIYKGIFGDPWQFCHNDTITNYSDRATVHPGENNNGYIEIDKALFDAFWGDTTLVFEFSNGVVTEIVVSSPDVLVSSNYDETTTFGSNGGTLASWTPFNWGFNGTFEFVEFNGSNVLRVNSASGSEVNMFTSKYYPTDFSGISEWFAIEVNDNDCYRIKFDYRFEGVPEARFFYYTGSDPNDYTYNAYTDSYNEVWALAGYHIMVWNLIVDGQMHSFDSGWIKHHNSGARLSVLYFPGFAEGAGSAIFDNYQILRSNEILNPIINLPAYEKSSSANLEIDVLGHEVSKLMIGSLEVSYVIENNKIVINSTVLSAIENGTYLVVLYSNVGVFKGNLIIT